MAADWSVRGSGTVASDYLFRGLSQTRNGWAFQGAAEAQHASGLYLGTFLTNAAYLAQPADPTRQEVDVTAGWRGQRGATTLDLGLANYAYLPTERHGAARLLQYQAVMAGLVHTHAPSGVAMALSASLDLFEGTVSSTYVEAGLAVPLPLALSGVATLGYQVTLRNPRIQVPDYLWYRIGLERPLGRGVTATLGWYGTTVARTECAPVPDRADGGQRICAGRVLATLAWAF